MGDHEAPGVADTGGEAPPTTTRARLETLKLYHAESKAAREQLESLVDKYRSNTSTLLALATAAVAFFGFSDGPRQYVCYWIAVGAYLIAVFVAMSIFAPVGRKINVAHDTHQMLFRGGQPLSPVRIYYAYAEGHQEAIRYAVGKVDGRFGLANRFRVLIALIGALILAASLSVALGSKEPPGPTRVIIEKGGP